MKKKKKSSWGKQLAILLIIGVAVFVTVQLAGQRQTTEQRASEGEVGVSATPAECKTVTLTSYSTTKCTTGEGVNTVNYICSDGFKGTLGGAACYGEAQMIAYAKNSCELRSTCTDKKNVEAPTPTYIQTP